MRPLETLLPPTFSGLSLPAGPVGVSNRFFYRVFTILIGIHRLLEEVSLANDTLIIFLTGIVC